jgi:hypothetical protein
MVRPREEVSGRTSSSMVRVVPSASVTSVSSSLDSRGLVRSVESRSGSCSAGELIVVISRNNVVESFRCGLSMRILCRASWWTTAARHPSLQSATRNCQQMAHHSRNICRESYAGSAGCTSPRTSSLIGVVEVVRQHVILGSIDASPRAAENSACRNVVSIREDSPIPSDL